MTRDQAKQALLLARPWVKDSTDPELAEALALVQQDPELQSWFNGHCELQRVVRDSFRTLRPPEAFREQIVSECRARRRSVSRRTMLAGVCALLLVGVGLEAYFLFGDRPPGEEISFAAFEQRMSRDARRLYQMDRETGDLGEIRTYLAQSQSPADYTLPAGLASAKATGCVATKWQGRPVSMICFRTGKPLPPSQNSDLFLFVIAQDKLPDPPTGSSPTFAQVNGLSVASWSVGGNTYLLASEHGVEELRKNL